jgi:hypothetical protein
MTTIYGLFWSFALYAAFLIGSNVGACGRDHSALSIALFIGGTFRRYSELHWNYLVPGAVGVVVLTFILTGSGRSAIRNGLMAASIAAALAGSVAFGLAHHASCAVL